MQCKQSSQALWTHLKSKLDLLWHLLQKGLSLLLTFQEFAQGSKEQTMEGYRVASPVLLPLIMLVYFTVSMQTTVWPIWPEHNVLFFSISPNTQHSTNLQQKHNKHGLTAQLKLQITSSSIRTFHKVSTRVILVKTSIRTYTARNTHVHTMLIYYIHILNTDPKSRKEFTS